MLSNHAFPCITVRAYSRIEITKDDDIVCIWDIGDNRIQFFVELVLDLIWACHGGSVSTDKCGKLLSMG